MTYSKEEKARKLEEWKKSGKSAWRYARENGISCQTFYVWVKREAEKTGGFTEIPNRTISALRTNAEIVVEKEDVRIRVPLSVWVEGSREIVAGLRAAL